MEKKRDKEIDFKLKPEGDSPTIIEAAMQEPSPMEVPCADGVVPKSETEQSPSPSVKDLVPKSKALEPSSVQSQNSVVNNRSVFSRITFRSVLIGLALLTMGAGLTQTWHWYCNAPRGDRPIAPFLTPTLLGGLVGDPDAAFAMQMVPVIVSETSTGGGKGMARLSVPAVQKQISFESLNQFIAQSSGDKSLSTLAMGTTLSARGQASEAVKTMRPLIDSTDNPTMKGYLALLLGLAGDYRGSLSELDKGIAAANAGKVWMAESGFHTLYTMKAAILRDMGRPEEALAVLDSPECVESCKSSQHDRDELLLSKAAAYLYLGQPDKAIVLACQGKELNRMVLSTAYLMKGDYNEALTQAQSTYLALSRIYSQQGRLVEALKYAENADAAINSITTREQHVYVLNQLKKYKQALSLSADLSEFSKLSNAIGSMAAMVQIHADRAFAFAQLGDARNAILEAELALHNNPSCRTALEAAKQASTILGDLDQAARYQNSLNQLKSTPDLRPLSFNSLNKK